MNTRILTVAIGAAIALAAPVTQAKSLEGDVATRGAIEAYKQSPEQLRRYINRTRMIYGLSYWDFAKDAKGE